MALTVDWILIIYFLIIKLCINAIYMDMKVYTYLFDNISANNNASDYNQGQNYVCQWLEIQTQIASSNDLKILLQ